LRRGADLDTIRPNGCIVRLGSEGMVNISKIPAPTRPGGTQSVVEEQYYFGTISHDESKLAKDDPKAFLKLAGVAVPENAEVRLSVEETGGRTLARSTRGGTRPVKGGEMAARRVIVVETGCYIVVIVIDGIIIARVICTGPIIVIACW
jgi:hypothetical protein